MRSRTDIIAVLLVAVGILVGAGTARAQDHEIGRSPALLPVTVDDLLTGRERSDAVGIRSGAFIFLPSITAAAAFDDNVFAAPRNEKADMYWRLSPELRVVSNWSRHALELYASGSALFYDRYSSENRTDATVGISGLLEIHHDLWLRMYAKYAFGHEERGIGKSLRAYTEPIATQTGEVGALLQKRFNRVWIEVAPRLQTTDYSDARLGTLAGPVIVDQQFRNGVSTKVAVRAGYELSRLLSIFAETALDWRSYTDFSFDAQGVRLMVGLRYEFTRRLYGEVAGGSMHEDVARGMRPIDTFAMRAQVRWEPTPLVTLAFLANRDLGAPSDLALATNTLVTDTGVKVTYAIRRHTKLTGAVSYQWYDYVDLGRGDELLRLSVGAEQEINPYLSAFASYMYTTLQAGSFSGVDYAKNVVTAGIRARY